jgi:SnoaL-like domain/Prokaryotic membrane lipoprotein lipid attachment site
MRRTLFAALALTVLAACQPATTELTDGQKAEIAAEVNALHADFWDAWRAADVDRGLSYYPNIPEITYATDGDLFVGPSEVEDQARSWGADLASQTITITESHTTVLSSSIVCINERATYSQTNNAGVTAPERVFAGTYIWVLRNGEWKVEISHESGPISENP